MENLKLKYPLVLVHGIAAKDKNIFWGRIPAVLKQCGNDVFTGNTDSWGNVESNAFALKETVDNVLAMCGTDKVNVISHSKGGIDARYLISTLGYGDRVSSLTTISSPHNGSELVDFISNIKYVHTKLSKKLFRVLAKLYGDKMPDPYHVMVDLTSKNMQNFNENNPNDPRVFYSAYYSVMKNDFDDLSYFLTHNYLKKAVGRNDGIVSEKSALGGVNPQLITGMSSGISHLEIIDIKRRKISGVDIPAEYLKIMKGLKIRGY